MNNIQTKAISIFEIILLISLSISFSYMVNESNYHTKYDNQNDIFIGKALALIGKIIFSDNFVSAQGVNLQLSDASGGANTCLLSKSGEYCKQYPSSSCDNECSTSCIRAPLSQVNECHGTCYNPINGVCTFNSPKALCPSNWINDSNGNVNQCRLGCCVLGQKTSLVTDQECSYLSSGLGIQKDFRASVTNTISCLALENNKISGACLYGNERQCRFVTKEECQNSIKGQFFENSLCSNSALNTSCEKQASTGCVEGKDEVYWFDSCGNRENIFSVPRTGSWNNGFVLDKSQSCNISTNGKVNCGNCNYLQGNICGRASSKSEVSVGDFVCKDLSCIDKNGNKRQNLESWCAYQGSTGVEGNRGTDTPGSRHFRNTCIRGEIVRDSCADYRNEICVQADTDIGSGKKFSTAACRINRWQECVYYNTFTDKAKSLDSCNKNPDCFVKGVKLSSEMQFNLCAPKYAPGFSLEENGRGDGAESICSLANQKCKYIKVKKLSGKKEINKECLTKQFTEQMNDFCTSLGDCGAKVNYLGDLSESYSVINAPKLSVSYLSSVAKYADERLFKGKFADPGDIGRFYGSFGVTFSEAGFNKDALGMKPQQTSAMIQQYAGIAGIGLLVVEAGGFVAGSAGLFGGFSAGTAGVIPAATYTAFSGALAGGAAGLAITGYLLKISGVGRGLPDGVAYGLLALGAVGGAMAGMAFASAASTASAAGAGLFSSLGSGFVGMFTNPAGLIILAVALIIIGILKVIGIGKVTEVEVSFTCKPWQAKSGGRDCGKCGSDGFPCSKYACESLGQTCEVINENTDKPECIDVNPGDSSAPIIRPFLEIITNLHRYDEINDNGFKIKSQGGCLEPYTNMIFGIKLNEAGECRFDTKHTNSFEEMEDTFVHSSLYKQNHTIQFIVPSLEEFGIDSLRPNASAEFNIYARCRDKRGNLNVNEYVINSCIKKGIDITPPVIVWKSPIEEIFAWNSTEEMISLFTNEPAECKWDKSDINYSSMSNEMQCANSFSDRKIYGWECFGDFPIDNKKNIFYVRCKDQPYLVNDSVISDIPINSTANKTLTRNVNVQSFNFSIMRSENALKIDKLEPNGTIIFGNAPASVLLDIRTSGGVNGRANCKYSISSPYLLSSGDSFIPPGQITHRANLQLFEGLHDVEIHCEDIGGNVARKISHFNVKIDSVAPKVTRVYVKNGVLNVVTDEDAKCSYLFEENCANAFTNGTSMNGENGKVHSIQYNAGKTYYISCKDKFERSLGSVCNAIITPGKRG